jgi:hypothetical protein
MTDDKGTLVSCYVQTEEPCLVLWRIITEPDKLDKITFDEGNQRVFKHGTAGFTFSVYFERDKSYLFMIDFVNGNEQNKRIAAKILPALPTTLVESTPPAYYDEPQFYKNVPEAYL